MSASALPQRDPWSSSVTIHLNLDLSARIEPGADPITLEEVVAAEGRRAARELYREIVRMLDEDMAIAEAASRQRLEERWVSTLMGRVRIARYRMKEGDRTYHPLDSVLDLSRGETSPGLRAAIGSLSGSVSWRQLSKILRWVTGETVSPQTCRRVCAALDSAPIEAPTSE
jgi:hypothetical protein